MAMGGKNERGYRIGVEEASSGFLVPEIAPSLQASQAIGDPADQVAYVVAAPLSHGSNPNSNAAGRRREDDENLVAYALRKDLDGTGQGHNTNYVTSFHNTQDPISDEKVSMPIGRKTFGMGVQENASVRRLMPVECERLQALPDGWTDTGGTADSKRYAALGDAVTASVAEWVGKRLIEA